MADIREGWETYLHRMKLLSRPPTVAKLIAIELFNRTFDGSAQGS